VEGDEWKCAYLPESNHYERIGLNPDGQYSTDEIDEAYQVRRNWWKARQKQRDGGQHSNELIKKVGHYIDDALKYLEQSSKCLLNAETKRAYDRSLEKSRSGEKEAKLLGFIAFTLRDNLLTTTEKRDLLAQARELGITSQRAEQLIWEEIAKSGAREVSDEEVISQAANQREVRPLPKVDPPQLVVSQTNFSLGTLRKGDKRECTFSTDNKGGGILQGNIEVADPEWLSVSDVGISGRKHHQDIRVFVDTSSLDLGSNYSGFIYIHSNGGKSVIRLDLSVEIEKSAVSRLSKALFWLGFLLGGIIGYALYTTIPNPVIDLDVALLAGTAATIMAIVTGAKMGNWGGGIGGFFLALVAAEIFKGTSMVAYSIGAWATIYAGILYVTARPLLIGRYAKKPAALVSVSLGTVGLTAIIVVGGVVLATTQATIPEKTVVEDFDGTVRTGRSFGIVFEPALGGRGAVFSRARSSRIEFPVGIPPAGTLEFVVNITSGYYYQNSRLYSNQSCALIFTTDIQGGDVTWPGSTWLYACANGDVSLTMATQMGGHLHQTLKAAGTQFRFKEWHSIGISYGSNGQAIKVDGILVGSDPSHHQTLGAGGDESRPKDIPTIGESVSSFFQRHQHEGGFEGVVRRFRASTKQLDWLLAAQPAIGGTVASTTNELPQLLPLNSIEIQDINQLLSRWTESLKRRDLDEQMNCYAPQLDHYFKKDNVAREVIRADKELALTRFSSLQVNLTDVQINPQAPDRAAVEFKKTWDFERTPGGPFVGQGQEKLVVARTPTGWVIVSELEMQVASGVGVDTSISLPNQMPSAIKTILDNSYPGWSPVTSSADDIQRCKQPNEAFKYWFVWGDFDGDGARDYAVEFTHVGNVYLMVFFSRGVEFQPLLVDTFSDLKQGWKVLGVIDKGQVIPDLSDRSNSSVVGQKRKLETDALLGVACGASAVAYVYSRTGSFERIFVQD
jgi:hypothetical protein